MKLIVIALFVFFSLDGYSQDARDYVILLLIKQAVEENKLPPEVINLYDSADHGHRVVAIQLTKENELNGGAHTSFKGVDYSIWASEQLFTRSPYWVTPGKIKRRGNKISFKFETSYLGTEQTSCYKGVIKGELKERWVLTTCSYRSTICSHDLEKLATGSNALTTAICHSRQR